MDRVVPDSAALSAIILDAPAWAQIGLTVRDPRMRQRAAQEIAETVLDRLDRPVPVEHPDQLPLEL
jgi:hypothetical protein